MAFRRKNIGEGCRVGVLVLYSCLDINEGENSVFTFLFNGYSHNFFWAVQSKWKCVA
jgi:hypothetical protein